MECNACSKSFNGGQYILKNNKKICTSCFNEKLANICEKCQKKIEIGNKDLSYNNRHWHEACFECADCRASLTQIPFAEKDSSVYCERCYDEKFASKCDECKNAFRGGNLKYIVKGRQLHERCFLCSKCQVPIRANAFVPVEERIICIECYEANLAPKCVNCQKPISTKGLEESGKSYHHECFQCSNCSMQLDVKRFSTRGEKLYCPQCFENLFGIKCEECQKILSPGKIFVSYNDKYWHKGCWKLPELLE
ncbi:unnamed protein product [Dimorphilus gyrociliatus]|uniref:LIM zinc-binding domain-containing protein n=1 Tax=Dimorphilus gyrociliatus TaxID=2664684 RepID=A0A7I8VP96_9ANNE|nr:unnamed protein product [Dimorphilus gyrociliatus]